MTQRLEDLPATTKSFVRDHPENAHIDWPWADYLAEFKCKMDCTTGATSQRRHRTCRCLLSDVEDGWYSKNLYYLHPLYYCHPFVTDPCLDIVPFWDELVLFGLIYIWNSSGTVVIVIFWFIKKIHTFDIRTNIFRSEKLFLVFFPEKEKRWKKIKV